MLIAVLAYLLLNVGIGIWAATRVKNGSEFIQAGRRLPFLFNATALFALWFGAETVMGASGEFAEKGWVGVIEDPLGGVLCLLLFGTFLAGKLYRLKILSLGDLFRIRFGVQAEKTASVFMVLSFFGYVAAQLLALGTLWSLLSGWNMAWSLVFCTAVIAVYTLVGGMWSVSLTDFLQSIVIVVGLLAAVFSLWNLVDDKDALVNTLPGGVFHFFPQDGNWAGWWNAWTVLGLGSLASQDIFQRVNAAHSEKAAVGSAFAGAALYGIIAMLPLATVLLARYLLAGSYTGEGQGMLLEAVSRFCPQWVQVVFFGALISAVMSTCSGALLAPSTILAENLLQPVFNKAGSEKRHLLLLRLSVLIIALISLLFCFWKTNIYELVGEASVLGMVTVLVPMVIGLFVYKEKGPALPALLSMWAGLVSWLIIKYALGWELADLAGLGISCAVWLVYFLGLKIRPIPQ